MQVFFIYLTIGIIFIFYSFVCHAAPRLMVSPPIKQIEVYPGAVKTFSLLVGNTGDNECKIRMYTTDLLVTKTGSTIFPPAGTSKWSCASWIEIKPQEEVIAPGETKMLMCKLKVPRDALGGRYAVIMVEAVPEEIIGRTPIFWRLTSMILVTVKGPGLERKISVIDFQINPIREDKRKFKIFCEVKNTGNVYLPARGYVTIKNKRGFRVGEKISLSPEVGTFLPDTIINFEGYINRRLPDGVYIAELSFEYKKHRQIVSKQVFTVGDVEKEELLSQAMETTEMETTNFWIEPVEINMEIYPGGFQSKMVTIRNEEKDNIISVTNSVVDYSQESSLYSCKQWVSLSPARLTLRPGQQRNIKISVRIPRKQKGSKYAKVIFKATSEGKKPRVSSCPLIVNILRTLEKKAEIDSLKVEQIAVDNIKITGTLKNTGNTHFQASGKVNILDTNNIIIATLTISGIDSIILPGSNITFDVIWKEKKMRPGKYTAEAWITYEKRENPLILRKIFEIKGE